MPVISRANLNQFLIKQLNNLCLTLPANANQLIRENKQHTNNVLHLGLLGFFKDIREVKRYINALFFNIKRFIVDGFLEVNPMDFFAIEAIRITAQPYYYFIQRNKSIFISSSNTSNRQNEHKELITSKIQEFNPDIQNALIQLTIKLFPRLNRILNDGPILSGNEWDDIWNKELRICSTHKFDKYFTLEPINDEMSQSEIMSYRTEIFSDNAKNVFIEAIQENHLHELIDIIYDVIRVENFNIDKNKLICFLQAIFDVFDILPRTNEVFGYDNLIFMIPIIFNKIGYDKKYNFQILSTLFENSENGVFVMLHILIRITSEEKTEDTEYWNLFEGDFDILIKIWLNKVEPKFNDFSIVKYNKLTIILHWFNKFKNENDILQGFVKSLMNDVSLLIIIVGHCVGISTSIGMHGDASVESQYIQFKPLAEFFDLEIINALFLTEQYNKSELYNQNQGLIHLYLKQFPLRDQQIF